SPGRGACNRAQGCAERVARNRKLDPTMQLFRGLMDCHLLDLTIENAEDAVRRDAVHAQLFNFRVDVVGHAVPVHLQVRPAPYYLRAQQEPSVLLAEIGSKELGLALTAEIEFGCVAMGLHAPEQSGIPALLFPGGAADAESAIHQVIDPVQIEIKKP